MVTGRSAGSWPDERHAITHKFDIQGHEGYITVGSCSRTASRARSSS
jgi:hypothetical protein